MAKASTHEAGEGTGLPRDQRTHHLLMVTRLDRLARSTRDLLNSLADTWADTTTPHGRLMVTVLGGLAEFERDLIRARTSEGRDRAKERGVKLGRKSKLTTFQKREALIRRENGEVLTEIARSYNVSYSTISRLRMPKGAAFSHGIEPA